MSSSLNLARIWSSVSELSIGEMTRYRICFDSSKHKPSSAWPPTKLILDVTNATSVIFRGAILTGPYNISASVIETKYRSSNPESTLVTSPKMKASIKCGETWREEIEIPTSGIGDWTIDKLSEILFSCTKVKYDVKLYAALPEGTSKGDLTSDYSSSITHEFLKHHEIFKLPDLSKLKVNGDYHLIVLTHGVHGSMLDELFLKEVIEERYKDKDIIFFMTDVNHSNTEDGVEKCGKRLATNLLEYLGWPWDDNKQRLISRISFVGHSLGGLINIFLLGYLHSVTEGKFFEDIKPLNFVAIASPLLGSSELPWYITTSLRVGVIGQTGKDLALVPRKPKQRPKNGLLAENNDHEPLLLSLARTNSPSHIALSQFKYRTIYANVANDVPVSFRTSALYFHDSLNINSDQKMSIGRQLQHLLNALNPSDITEEIIKRSCESKSPIIHDKVYSPTDIPTPKENISIEEKIARAWHEDMTWRKVFVLLEGEAHTNVVVRRKWLNISGWKVIDHLSKEHEF